MTRFYNTFCGPSPIVDSEEDLKNKKRKKNWAWCSTPRLSEWSLKLFVEKEIKLIIETDLKKKITPELEWLIFFFVPLEQNQEVKAECIVHYVGQKVNFGCKTLCD